MQLLNFELKRINVVFPNRIQTDYNRFY